MFSLGRKGDKMANINVEWTVTGEPTINFAERIWYSENGYWVNSNGDKLAHIGSCWTLNETNLLGTSKITGIIALFECAARKPKFANRFHALLRGHETEKQIVLRIAAEENAYIEDTGDYHGLTFPGTAVQ